MITPDVFAGGLPGDINGRTPALWIEEDAPRTPGVIGWPYGWLPRQHHCARHRACSTDLAAMASLDYLIAPAGGDGPAPAGYRKIPWPPPEADAAQYRSPYEAIIKPALERLRVQQLAALRTTEVCAYVRPLEVGGLPAYGAFRDPTLRQLCLDMRARLLTSPRRFCVNLADAQAIDPAYAEQLRQAGVTGGFKDRTTCLGLALAAPLVDGAEPPPAGLPPEGGVAFEGTLAGAARRGGGKGAAAGVAAALLGALWLRS